MPIYPICQESQTYKKGKYLYVQTKFIKPVMKGKHAQYC